MKKAWLLFGPYFLTAAIMAFLLAWYNPTRSFSTTPDTEGYILLSEQMNSEIAQIRPPGYSLIIKMHKFLFSDQWESRLVITQAIMLVFLAMIVLNLFHFVHIPSSIAVPVSCFIGVCPSFLWAAKTILPELPLTLVVTSVWMFWVRLFSSDLKSRHAWIAAAGIGILSGWGGLLKPVWLYGVLSLAGAFILLSKNELRKRTSLFILLIVGAHFFICMLWQFFLIVQFKQYKFSNLDALNLNLASIRAGLTREAEGTPLYDYLKKEGLLEDALYLKPEEFEKFTALKIKIPHKMRCDDRFWKSVIKNNPWAFLKSRFQYWGWFFIIRPGGSEPQDFPGMPSLVRYLYLGTYNWIFRPLLPLLLVMSFFLGLYGSRANLWALTVSGFAVLIYFSLLLAIICFQEPVLMRLRIPILPVLLILASLPVCLFMERIVLFALNKNKVSFQ